ncbi:MAG: PIN domain-containing protein [Gemmatimonadota bacterium]|nr:PIN domain-containing protein [Gemmatimonadota bacterium]
MIVYLESNFVLELAFLQAEHDECSALLRLAEVGKISLILPAFSIGEPYETWVRRTKRRRQIHEDLTTAIRELSRSSPYEAASERFHELTSILIRSGEEEKRRLDETLEGILQTVEVIPVGLNVMSAAISLQEKLNLSPQDSIVYASVLDHLNAKSRERCCFITRNSRDFANPHIEHELSSRDCLLLTKFADGMGYVRRHLQ